VTGHPESTKACVVIISPEGFCISIGRNNPVRKSSSFNDTPITVESVLSPFLSSGVSGTGTSSALFRG
jgi:hypothetical protein